MGAGYPQLRPVDNSRSIRPGLAGTQRSPLTPSTRRATGRGAGSAPPAGERVRSVPVNSGKGVHVRRWLAALTAVVGMAILASPALASRPTREFSPFSNESYSGVCTFTVERQILANNSYLTTFSDGTQLY